MRTTLCISPLWLPSNPQESLHSWRNGQPLATGGSKVMLVSHLYHRQVWIKRRRVPTVHERSLRNCVRHWEFSPVSAVNNISVHQRCGILCIKTWQKFSFPGKMTFVLLFFRIILVLAYFFSFLPSLLLSEIFSRRRQFFPVAKENNFSNCRLYLNPVGVKQPLDN